MSTLGERIRELREQKAMSQEELADKSGVTRQYVSLLEKDQRTNPASKELANIASSLNTTVEYLLYGKREQKFPGLANMDDELKEIFYELVNDPNASAFLRADKNLDSNGLKSILEYIRFTKHKKT